MILNKFYINVFIRVICIVLSGVAFGIVLQNLDRGYYYTLTAIILLIVLQTYLMVNQVNKTNEDLEKFLSSVQDHDSSAWFADNLTIGTFSKLHERMNEVNAIIQKAKIENERTRHFLQMVVDHIGIGLISFDTNGNIEIYNKAAKKYLSPLQPRNLSYFQDNNNEIYLIINSIKPGQEVLHRIFVDNMVQSILIKSTELRLESNTIKLVSFENITNALDKKELSSWQKLIRVLTHEIMNSISPITSLTSVISGYFKKDNGEPVPPEKISSQIIDRTISGLNTIEETGKGLSDFVNRYRSLTSIPKPNVNNLHIGDLFQKCQLLMETNFSHKIKIVTNVYPMDIAIMADLVQMEQILINLIKNAGEALENIKNATIHLKAFAINESTIIQVEDNGSGIPDDVMENIFVPFYTTKENGSGIGLSLSRQIMQNHNGTISVNSVLNKGTTVTLKFRRI